MWPTFLIIGAAKAGTTALYHYLRQHPDVYMSPVKEPNFFALDGRPARFGGIGDQDHVGRASVADPSAYRRLFAEGEGMTARGEASPLYLYDARAPERIYAHVPGVRLIAVLRDPVERAHSSYLHLVRDGREPCRTFASALAEEPRRIEAGWEHLWHYRAMGYYGAQLQRYLDRFDRSQLRVILYEDFTARPLDVLRDLFAFLGVDPDFVPDMGRQPNRSGLPRSRLLQRALLRSGGLKAVARAVLPERIRGTLRTRVDAWNLIRPSLSESIRADLAAGYADDLTNLEVQLGRDLTAWRVAHRQPTAGRSDR